MGRIRSSFWNLMSLQCLRLTGNDILNELPKVLILMQLKFLSHRTRALLCQSVGCGVLGW